MSKMNKPPSKFICPNRPPEYKTQWYVHCGMYCVQNILSALGRETHEDPRDYHIKRSSRARGKNVPDELALILNQNGVRSEVKTAMEMRDDERLAVLKTELAKGNPVILKINNGYTRSGKYFSLQAWLLQKVASHWITVYGYDDDSEKFYIYDPYTEERKGKEKPPIGNIARPYQDVLRDWKDVLIYKPKRYIYISLSTHHKT
jgi:hypothetical protein